MNNVKVGLVQIGDSFGGQYYFPYSIGILQAYAEKNLQMPGRYEFLVPIYKKLLISEACEYLNKSDIIFFSSYLWNFRINLEIAKNIKKNNSQKVIVFGGSQIPKKAKSLEALMRTYPFIDIACYGEGEIPFVKILDNFFEAKWEDVPSVAYLDKGGEFINNPIARRMTNLDSIPSPYLEGTFDRLMNENPNTSWSAMWETNRGCPFSCAFCAWGQEENKKIYHYDISRLFKEIDWFSSKRIEFIFCCDANFGMFERDYKISERIAENKIKYGYPKAFSIQNTKNSTEKIVKIQKILNENGLQKGVNLALQSVNPQTLKSIKRDNIKIDTYRSLQRKFASEGIPTFSDILLGLPDETYKTLTEGVSSLIENGQHNKIQFINLAVLENTQMAEPEYQKEHGLILQKSRIISHHTSLNEKDEVYETQLLAVGTKDLPKEKWVDSRAFCWMTTLLHFNKLLQIPFIVLNKICSTSYKELVELFLSDSEEYPCISEIYYFFRKKAKDIQGGDFEYIPSKEWLNIWWPPDEYIFIKLCKEKRLPDFYKEAEEILTNFVHKKNLKFDFEVLNESVRLNSCLMKIPFVDTNLEISLRHNCYEVYEKTLKGLSCDIREGNYVYVVDRIRQKWSSWDDWFREVVWYGTKRGAFMYSCYEKNIVR